jgi:hypothetical protein
MSSPTVKQLLLTEMALIAMAEVKKDANSKAATNFEMLIEVMISMLLFLQRQRSELI